MTGKHDQKNNNIKEVDQKSLFINKTLIIFKTHLTLALRLN